MYRVQSSELHENRTTNAPIEAYATIELAEAAAEAYNREFPVDQNVPAFVVELTPAQNTSEWSEVIRGLEVCAESAVTVSKEPNYEGKPLFDVTLVGLYPEQVQEIVDIINENGSTFARPF